MVSRNKDKLEKAKSEVLLYAPQSKVVVEAVDLSKLTKYSEYEESFRFTKKYDIGLLINNAGINFEGPFEKMSMKEVQDIVNVNMLHPIYLTKVILS